MAGIVAAATNNDRGVAGVGFDGVKVIPVTVLGADGTGRDSDIIEGIVYAADHGANVILMSFSNPGYSASLQAAIDYAWGKGAVLVAATGNDGSSTPTFPAGDRGVVGVASTGMGDSLSPASNYGTDTFLAAPGEGIATVNGTVTGTSASAAIVAGSAALIKAASAGASNGVIVSRLARTADPAGSTSQTGNGRVNLARAISDASSDFIQPAGVGGSGGPIVGPYVAAANIQGDLQTQNKVPCVSPSPCPWQTTLAQGWAELDTPPVRLFLPAGQLGDSPTEFTLSVDRAGNVPGLEGLTFVSKSSNVTMSPITFSSSSTGGETFNYTFTVDMTNDSEGEVRFTTRLLAGSHAFTGASLQIKGAGTIGFNKPAAAPGTPDLQLTKTGLTTAAPGQTLTYTLAYQNLVSGGDAATGVQITDVLPAEVSYVAGSCTGCTYDSTSHSLSWILGSVALGASGTRTYQVTVGSGLANGVSFSNDASIQSSQNDDSLANNFSSVTTNVVVTAISGTVLDDEDGDGVDDSDPPLAGAIVRLYRDSNTNGVFDSATDVQVGASITTSGTGDWSFNALPAVAGTTYFVRRTNPADYASTNAIAGTGVNSTTTKVDNDLLKVVFGSGTVGRSTNNKFLAHYANQAPTATSQSVTTNEDTSKLITLTGSDPESAPLTFTITSLPANGTLYRGNGTTDEITAGGTVLAGSIVTFVPAANASGSPYATFQFAVSDGSLNSSAATVTVNVTAVNDAPAGANASVTTPEDVAYTFAAGDFGFSDPTDCRPPTSSRR